MHGSWAMLVAISTNVIPELRAAKEQYYFFWNIIGGAAIIGMALVYVLYRRRSPTPLVLATVVAAAVACGSSLGWVLWMCLQSYSWGDIGVSHRWISELLACTGACVALLLLIAWAFFFRSWDHRPLPGPCRKEDIVD
jgi:hypothetical protein